MKRSRKNYSPEFKAKVVLELLQENKTINEIASKYGILPKSLIEWKKQFLENAALAFYTFPQILDSPLSLVHLLLRMAYNKREGGQR